MTTLARPCLARPHVLSIVIALIAAGTSIAGIAYGPDFYGAGAIAGVMAGPAGVLVPGFGAQDIFTLALGVPLLLITVLLAARGSFLGLLLWPGMLFNLLYTYVHYLAGAPFSILFIVYVLLVTLCAYATVWSLVRIDTEAIRIRLGPALPARALGGVLVALALMTVAQDAGGAVTTALAHAAGTDLEARRVWTADLTIAAPAMLVGGALLWRRVALGYVVGAGLFLSFSLFSAELAAMLALQPTLTGGAIDGGTIVGLLVFALAGLVPLALITRADATDARRTPLAEAVASGARTGEPGRP